MVQELVNIKSQKLEFLHKILNFNIDILVLILSDSLLKTCAPWNTNDLFPTSDLIIGKTILFLLLQVVLQWLVLTK